MGVPAASARAAGFASCDTQDAALRRPRLARFAPAPSSARERVGPGIE
jgi:hypothetical protein